VASWARNCRIIIQPPLDNLPLFLRLALGLISDGRFFPFSTAVVHKGRRYRFPLIRW